MYTLRPRFRIICTRRWNGQKRSTNESWKPTRAAWKRESEQPASAQSGAICGGA